MTKLERLSIVLENLIGNINSSKIKSAAKKEPNEVTRLADEYISMWEELPISQQKPVVKESDGVLKEGYTKAQADAVLDQLLKAATPKIKMAISRHLHDGYRMEDALADAYQRVWRYIIPTWDKSKQKDFEKQIGLATGSWASTIARKYKRTRENEEGLTYSGNDGEEVEKNVGHTKDSSSDIEFKATLDKITKGDDILEDLVEYLIDNYTKKPNVLRREAIKKFKLSDGEYETAISRLAERLFNRPVTASKRLRCAADYRE